MAQTPSLDHIQYIIEDKQSYNNDINNITQKNPTKKWISQFPMKQIVINAKFKSPCYITKAQVRGQNSDALLLQFFDHDADKIQQCKFIWEQDKNSTIKSKNFEMKTMAVSIKITLISTDATQKQMGLNFLIFRGQKNPMKNHSKNGPTNLYNDSTQLNNLPTKQKYQQPYRNMQLRQNNNNNLFNARQKGNYKEQNLINKEKKINSLQLNNKKNNDQDEQLLKAMKQSKQTYQKEIKNRKQSKTEDQLSYQQNTQPLSKPQRKYQITNNIKSLLKSTIYVNQRWLTAQKRAQQQAGVIQQQRLSNYIVIRHLNGRKIFIDTTSITGQKRSKIQMIAQKLGAVIVKSLSDYCLIISNSLQNAIVQQAIKQYKGIKAINQNYIEECYKVGAQLAINEYLLRRN